MAGDWIKMRVNLVTHPKVLAISEHLASDGEYQDWSTMAGFVPSCGGTKDEYERDYLASLRVTRYVTVCALLRFWGYANEHAKDEFIASLRVSDIDDVVQVPSFGDALEHVGWVFYDSVRRGINLPNFNEFNVSGVERSAGAKTAAQRQKEYRERLKSDVTRDVTNDVTRNRREEKSREEKKKEEIQETAPRKRSEPTSVIAKPDDVDQQTWADWLSHRKAKRATVTETVVNGARAESEKAGMSLDSFLQVWCRRGSQGLEADWIKPNERQTQSRFQPAPETAHMRQRREVAQGLVPSIARRAPLETNFIDMETPNVPAIASN